MEKRKMKSKNLIDSFNHATNGITYAIRNERNLKIHLIAAIGAFILSLFYHLSRIEFLVLCLTVSLVIVCELLNTAIEVVVDVFVEEFHPKAKIVKDVAAGAVMISAFLSIVVAYFLFYDRLGSDVEIGLHRLMYSKIHITFISLVITFLVILTLKSIFKKGTPFSGGMPSGHAAVSISLTTAITILTDDIKIGILCLMIALMVIQSRLEAKIHTWVELLAGGILGFLITFFLFQLLNR